MVRRRGQFSSIGSFASAEKAFAVASQNVASTAAASFKVSDSSGNVLSKLGNIGKDYYRSKKEKGVIIQKRSKRISSAGELREITFEGIKSNRRGLI